MPRARQSKPNTLTIAHQDGKLVFALERGGYCLKDEVITISVETEAKDEEQFPDCACICLENHPAKKPLRVGDVFECKGGLDQNSRRKVKAHGYFTFHASAIDVRWTVVKVQGARVTFSLKALHDDVDYYDARAKRAPTRGMFTLSPKPAKHLWIPT